MKSREEELARCDREIAAMRKQTDVPAWLVLRGIEDWEAEKRLLLGERGHVACPCWATGKFEQVPCRWHDGHGRYPIGAYAERALARGAE